MTKENTIVQVICETAEIYSLRPYLKPTTKMNAGSGVIVDSKNGLIITNAHVAGNAIMIQVFSPITGKLPLRCELVSIIRDKDLSLIKIIDEDLQQLLQLKDPENLDAKIIDHLSIPQGAQLFAAGFPLGTRLLQVTSGCLSGLSTPDSFVKIIQCEDSYARDSTFIATSAGLNFGMSGGGLFTDDGYLVGIITAGLPSANQIGFAIPSRIVLANYLLMKHNLLPRIPTFNFRWSNVNQQIYDYLTSSTSHHDKQPSPVAKGVLVRKVLQDSVFYGTLEKGDLLQEILFDLPEVNHDSLKKAENEEENIIPVLGHVESHGDVTLYDHKGKVLFERKFSISEISDYISYGSDITIRFLRPGSSKTGNKRKSQQHEKKIKYVYRKTGRIRGIYPLLERLNWMIIGGICLQDITLNTLAECPRYKYIDEISYYDDFLFRQSIVVTHVFPSSNIGSLNLFGEGDVITHVNGKPVKNLKDIKNLIESEDIRKEGTITVESDRCQFAVLNLHSPQLSTTNEQHGDDSI